MVDRDLKPRGFGFVTFKDQEAISRVFEDSQHVVDGKVVECKRAVPKEQKKGAAKGESSESPQKIISQKVTLKNATSPSLLSQLKPPKNFLQNPLEKAQYHYRPVKKRDSPDQNALRNPDPKQASSSTESETSPLKTSSAGQNRLSDSDEKRGDGSSGTSGSYCNSSQPQKSKSNHQGTLRGDEITENLYAARDETGSGKIDILIQEEARRLKEAMEKDIQKHKDIEDKAIKFVDSIQGELTQSKPRGTRTNE